MILSLTQLAAEGGGDAAHVAGASAGWLLYNAWIFPAVPFVSFLLILFFGKKLPKKGAEIGVAALAICFVMAIGAFGSWRSHVNGGEAEHTALAISASGGESAAGSVLLAAEEGGEAGSEKGEEAGEEHHDVAPVHRTWTWFTWGDTQFTVGTLVDGLSVMMLFVVGLISLLVHIYSTDYVDGDVRYTHYFAFLSLFTASMLLLVVSENVLQFITAWELVGVCSFCLIGHWWEDHKNSSAALKAFITNRVGDMGLLVGMITLFFTAGGGKTFGILQINEAAVSGGATHQALLVASLCLMAAVMSKSGQFFLHTWLPDAMAGPTPVSALIHAATMVVAGVFMIARLYGVFFTGFSISGSSFNMLALIGGLTTLVGGSLAFVQTDIKKVLAYSTVSQLGYMVLALGVGAWTGAIFHLFTHAFFKACLFLGSGSVSHACNHSFDMKQDMGGLRKYMPKTHATFLIGALALSGLPLLSGFWSKDEILAGTGGFGLAEGANGRYHVMLLMGLATGAMTAAYMTRCYLLTFAGEWRGADSPLAHAHSGHGSGHDAALHGAHDASDDHAVVATATGHDSKDSHAGLPHESGPRITIPLMVLAFMAIITTLANIPEKFSFFPEGWRLRFEHYVEPKGEYFPKISHAEFSTSIFFISIVLAIVGAGSAFAYYRKVFALGPKATALVDGPTSRNGVARLGYRVLENKFYLDWLYTDVIVFHTKTTLARMANTFNKKVLDGVVDGSATVSRRIAGFVYTIVDQKIVDGVVNGSGIGADQTGRFLRRMQTGRIQQYAALMFAAAAILAGVLVAVI